MKFQIIAISCLCLALVVSIGTCAQETKKAQQSAKEAQKTAETWEHTARTYAESLKALEEAQQRAKQSESKFLETSETIEAQHVERLETVEKLRDTDCDWMRACVPDGVRDIVANLTRTAACD